jgi:hypothetical protein
MASSNKKMSIKAGIQTQSKKIGKLPKETYFTTKPLGVLKDIETDSLLNTGYDTFAKEEKSEVLRLMKAQVADFERFSLYANAGQIDWVEHLKQLGTDISIEFLINAMAVVRPGMNVEERSVSLLKNVKGWFEREGLPEKRGGAVVPPEILPEFLEIMENILSEMKVKSFAVLQKRARQSLEEIYMRIGKEFKGNEFSKHYWWDFQERHSKIKSLWEKLPQTRAKKTSSPKSNRSHVSTCCTPSSDFQERSFETEYQLLHPVAEKNQTAEEEWIDMPLTDLHRIESSLVFMTNNFGGNQSSSIQEIQGFNVQDDQPWKNAFENEWNSGYESFKSNPVNPQISFDENDIFKFLSFGN